MTNLENAYWPQTILLICGFIVYAFISLDVRSWFTLVSSAFQWKPSQRFEPFNVTQGDNFFECNYPKDLSLFRESMRSAFPVILKPFIGVMLITIIDDLFSVEMLHLYQYFFKMLKQGYTTVVSVCGVKWCSKKEAQKIVHLEVYDPEAMKLPGNDFSFETKHAIFTVFLRISAIVTVSCLMFETALVSISQTTPVQNTLLTMSEVDLLKNLTYLKKSEGPNSFPLPTTAVPILVVAIIGVFLISIIGTTMCSMAKTSYEEYISFFTMMYDIICRKKELREIFKCSWKTIILTFVYICIGLVTAYSTLDTAIPSFKIPFRYRSRGTPTEHTMLCVTNGQVQDWTSYELLFLAAFNFFFLMLSPYIWSHRFDRELRLYANGQRIGSGDHHTVLLSSNQELRVHDGQVLVNFSFPKQHFCTLTTEPPHAELGEEDRVVPIFLYIGNPNKKPNRKVESPQAKEVRL